MGTPEFALPSLGILIQEGHEIAAVVTSPDKPSGRGLRLSSSPVKQFALEKNLNVIQPQSPKDELFISELRSLDPELFVVVAFRILPPQVFNIPRLGSINLHASLLPRYRGAAPINWAIINGEKETGVTTFFLQEKVDCGDIILQARLPIGEDETAGQLHDRLADVGAEIVLHSVNLIGEGKARGSRQDDSVASPAPKIFRDMCRIDWGLKSARLHDFIRGLSPHPAAFCLHRDKKIKIYSSRISKPAGLGPGIVSVEDGRLIAGTSDGSLEIIELQQEGKGRMKSGEFLRGYRIGSGDRFE